MGWRRQRGMGMSIHPLPYRLAVAGAVVALNLVAVPGLNALASNPPVTFVQQSSSSSFSDTIASLKRAISRNGMTVLGQLDQKGALSMTGLHLAGAHTFFVGNPVVGKKLFRMDPAVGAVVPLRIYVWVNAEGATHIGYFEPSQLLTAIDPHLAKAGTMLDATFEKIISQAAGKS